MLCSWTKLPFILIIWCISFCLESGFVAFGQIASILKHDSGSRLIIISFDGFRWDYLYRLKNLKNPSAFWRLITDYGSIYARDGMQSTFVTSTFPNHYTIATGLYQESHGIVANQIYDKNAKKTINLPDDTFDNRLAYLYGGEPIWRTVEKQLGTGKSACFMWTGCQNDNLTHFVPFHSNVSWTRTVRNVTDWLKMGAALIMVYNDEPDHIGHKKGTSSNEINRMLVQIDDQMEYFMDRLEENGYLTKNTTADENVNLIIVSDHGMLDITQFVLIKPRNELFSIRIENYAYLHIDPKPGKGAETMEYLRSIQNIVVYNRSEIPEKWGYKNNDRIGEIIVVALPHFGITLQEPKDGLNTMFGGHGYQPEIRDMHGMFLARGPAFKQNLTGPLQISTKDIYMIAASILKLNPAPNNGSREILSLILVDYDSAEYSFVVWVSVSVAVVIFSIFNYSLYLCCKRSMSKKINHFRMMNDDEEKVRIVAFSKKTNDENRQNLPLLSCSSFNSKNLINSSSESLDSI